MNARDPSDYLQDILEHIEAAERFVVDMTFAEFEEDEKTVFALIRALEVIGEATKQLPPELTAFYPEIPWRGFAGMRDKLIHAYFGVKLNILWNTTQEDLPLLKPVVQTLLNQARISDSKES